MMKADFISRDGPGGSADGLQMMIMKGGKKMKADAGLQLWPPELDVVHSCFMVDFEEDKSFPTNAFAGMLGLGSGLHHALMQRNTSTDALWRKPLTSGMEKWPQHHIWITFLMLFAEMLLQVSTWVTHINEHLWISPICSMFIINTGTLVFPTRLQFCGNRHFIYVFIYCWHNYWPPKQ